MIYFSQLQTNTNSHKQQTTKHLQHLLFRINKNTIINKCKANQRTLNKDFILYICQENEMTTELFVIKFLK